MVYIKLFVPSKRRQPKKSIFTVICKSSLFKSLIIKSLILVVIVFDDEINNNTIATIILIMNPINIKCCNNLTFGNK